MLIRLCPSSIVFWVVSLDSSSAHQAQSLDRLIVEVSGVHPGRGVVRATLWREEATFLKGHSFQHASSEATSESVRMVFEGIPAGRYAVSAYQDENNNGRLDTGFMGKPKEPYGFSNEARGTFEPPSFQAAAIDVSNAETVTRFHLK